MKRLFAVSLVAAFAVMPSFPRSLSALPDEDLQQRFDSEANSVRKAKLLEKLGNFQFEKARQAGHADDYNRVSIILEKYRDNARAAFGALKKEHPSAERQSNGYRQLQMHVHRAVHEVEDAMLHAPDVYKPPLQLVRRDLIDLDDDLLRLLFPPRAASHPAPAKPPENQP